MKILSKEEFFENKEFYKNEMIKGKIFIYPTDTIYGIGCDARISTSVDKIFEIKKRENKPFNIIVPSIEWIEKYFYMNHKEEFEKLPGPYSFILKPKSNCPLALNSIKGIEGVGLRIPDNEICRIICELGVPFVSTSVNISGEPSSTSKKDISNEILEQVDYMIDVGKINNPASQVYDLRGKIIKRLR